VFFRVLLVSFSLFRPDAARALVFRRFKKVLLLYIIDILIKHYKCLKVSFLVIIKALLISNL